MDYKIGIDFGTTNTIVSYLNKSGVLEAFRYPDPSGYEYIPSCVAYEDDGSISVGRSAYNLAEDPDALFCKDIKMVLPLLDKERENYHWAKEKEPEEVITDYLNYILKMKTEDASSLEAQKGRIEGVVLSVPHVWAKAMAHPGRDKLQSIVAKNLKLPFIQLISEPVAAAAYYAYKYQKEKSQTFNGNILICDIGGGTFDITLCRVEPGKVEELYNDGNGRGGLGKAGVYFDKTLIQYVYKENGKDIKDDSTEFYDIYDKLQENKRNDHVKITKRIKNAVEEPDFWGKPIMKFGRLKINYNHIKNAFEEVEKGILDVLNRFNSVVNESGYSINAIFLVGGFAQFYPVRKLITDFWKKENKNSQIIEQIAKEEAHYAISYGATLVANDKILVEEKYEHSIGIEAQKRIPIPGKTGEFSVEYQNVYIIKGGGKLSEYERPHYAPDGFIAHKENPEIVIFIDEESKNKIIKHTLPDELNIKVPNYGIPGNKWKVGFKINKSKVAYLIFEDEHGEKAEYELGDILRKVFTTLEIL